MEIDKIIGELPSDLRNPFQPDCIVGITIQMYRIFGKNTFQGNVRFKNGDTEGSQEFNGSDLIDVFIKVRNFCLELENGKRTSN